MKIFLIDTYYHDFLNDIYRRQPSLAHQSYDIQKQTLLAEKFGTSDFYSHNLNHLGQHAEEFIINAEFLQKQWAREHNVTYRHAFFQSIPRLKFYFKSNWLPKITEAQIEKFAPDIIYTQDINNTDEGVLLRMKKKYHCLLVAQIATTLPPFRRFAPYDLIISSLPNIVKKISQGGKNSFYLPLAFEPALLDALSQRSHSQNLRAYEVVHAGGYGPIHNERNQFLENIADQVPLTCWGYGIDNLKPQSPILKCYKGPAWGLERYAILNLSKITITKHITSVAQEYANNMTMFEATGCGSMLMVDHKSNIGDLFEPDKEIITYQGPKEAVEKIKYYLSHDDERMAIAHAGQLRTLRDHTWLRRMQSLVKILSEYTGNPININNI